MAVYKYPKYLSHSESDAYDKLFAPGEAAPYSGIYRCESCHKEVASNSGQPLPPQNHAQHSATSGQIKWRLVVYANHNPK